MVKGVEQWDGICTLLEGSYFPVIYEKPDPYNYKIGLYSIVV